MIWVIFHSYPPSPPSPTRGEGVRDSYLNGIAPMVASGVLDANDPSQFILMVNVVNPAFSNDFIRLELPSGTKTLSRFTSGSSEFFLRVTSASLSTEDWLALASTDIPVNMGGNKDTAQVKKNRVTPQLGGRVKVGQTEVIIMPNGVSQSATLNIQPEPSNGQSQRNAALSKGKLISFGSAKEIQLTTPGTLSQATLILPYDTTLAPGYDAQQAKFARYNTTQHIWQIQNDPVFLKNHRLKV